MVQVECGFKIVAETDTFEKVLNTRMKRLAGIAGNQFTVGVGATFAHVEKIVDNRGILDPRISRQHFVDDANAHLVSFPRFSYGQMTLAMSAVQKLQKYV